MKKIILMIFLANSSLSVQAEWYLYAIDEPDGNEFYYESSSIKKLPNNKRRIWEYKNYVSRINEFKINSLKAYLELDCNEESFKILQATSYEENHLKGLSKNFDGDPKPIFIAPKTVRSLLLKIACK